MTHHVLVFLRGFMFGGAIKFSAFFLCLFVLVSFGKHTLHVDTIFPSATETVLLRDVHVDEFSVGSLSLDSIELNLTGESNLILDTEGVLSMDASFINLSGPSVDIQGGRNAFLSTPGSVSLSGDDLTVEALHFVMNTGGDLTMNTDASLNGSAFRAGINSEMHTDLEVASGPLEFLAERSFEISALHTELVGDDRVSLYSLNAFTVDTVNSFAAYSAFIDFDSYGDIRLSSSTGNVHMDTTRAIVFEGAEIIFEAPVGVDVSSEHGEVYVNAASSYSATSSDTIYMETADDLRYVAVNDFLLSAEDLMLTSSERVQIRSNTLEMIYQDAGLHAQDTSINTGGNIAFDLNSRSPSTYTFGATETLTFDSYALNGVATDMTMSTSASGSVDIYSSSSFALDTADLSSRSSSLELKAPVLDFTADRARASAVNTLELSGSFGIGGLLDVTAGDRILLQSEAMNQSSVERLVMKASEDISFTSASMLVDVAGPSNLHSAGAITAASDNQAIFEAITNSYIASSDFVLSATTSGESDNLLLSAVNDAIFYSRGDLQMDATNISWVTNDITMESNHFMTSNTLAASFEGEQVDLWVNGAGDFAALNVAMSNEASLNLHAFSHITIDDLVSIVAGSILVEAKAFAGITVASVAVNSTNDINVFANNADMVYNGNSLSIDSATALFSGGFVQFVATDVVTGIFNSINILTEYEEDIHFTAGTQLAWDAEDFSILSSDDILLQQSATSTLNASDNINIIANEDFEFYSGATASFSGENSVSLSAENFRFLSGAPISFVSAGKTSIGSSITNSVVVDVQGSSEVVGSGSIVFESSDTFHVFQYPSLASNSGVSLSADNLIYTIDGPFSASGGAATAFSIGDTFSASANRILLDSDHGSLFTVDSITMNASVGPDSTIRLESADFLGISEDFVSIAGASVTLLSSPSEYITFTSTEGNVALTSAADFPITWMAAETFNVTALALGLEATAAGNAAGAGILLSVEHTVMSEMNIYSRVGEVEIISKNSQTFAANEISLVSAADILFSNEFPPADVGGVLFTSAGSEHDGIYEDESGISVRAYYPDASILFDVPLGSASVFAGHTISHIISDSDAAWTAAGDMPFTASEGDFDIRNEQGSVLLQSNTNHVVFITNANTELQASQSIEVLAGKAISLVSTDPILSPDSALSFEFSALEGNIITRAVVRQPIDFEGEDFVITSNEESSYRTVADLPFLTEAGFFAYGDTGVYLTVDGGNLSFTASDNIYSSSAENYDLSLLSGDFTTFTAETGLITMENIIDTVMITASGDILVEGRDPAADFYIDSSSEIRFQSDGTDANIGASQVDGIFVDAPIIQSFSRDDLYFDAGVQWTVGANTRPIITLEAGGDSSNAGVVMNAEGNINVDIDENFVISSQGALLMNTSEDYSFTTSGLISVVSQGSELAGGDVIFSTDAKMAVSANDIEMTGSSVISFLSDGLLTLDSDTLISLAITGSLRTEIDRLYDVNAADWTWDVTEDSFTMETLGDVVFTNGGTGGITLFGDTSLSFSSDVITQFFTFGPDSPLTVQTTGVGSTLIITAEDRSSDLLFEVTGEFVGSAVADLSFSTLGSIHITAPLDELYDSAGSQIDITSAADLSYSAAKSLEFRGTNGLDLNAFSDMSLSVDGDMYIQAWQDALFESIAGSIAFAADKDILFATEEGEEGKIELASTRDLLFLTEGALLESYDGDYEIHAAKTFKSTSTSLDMVTNTRNANFQFTSAGDVVMNVNDLLLISDILHLASGATTSINAGAGRASFETSGLHNKIYVESAGLLSFSTPLSSISLRSSTTSSEFESLRNGHGFLSFTSQGVHPQDDYSMRFESDLLTLSASNGYVNLYSLENLSIHVDNQISISGLSTFDDSTISFLAPSTGATSLFTSVSSVFFSSSTYFEASENILLLPFDNVSFSGFANPYYADDETERAALLIQSQHEEADLSIFTTDFLTADLDFITPSISIYSHDSTTLLLLDDDDAEAVGTFVFTSSGAINMAAEDDFFIVEFGSGDILLEDNLGEFYFTAGRNIDIEARDELLFFSTNLIMDAERSLSFSSPDLNFDIGSGTFRATDQLNMDAGDEMIFRAIDDINIATADGDPALFAEINQELFIRSERLIEFEAPVVSFQVNPHRVIDFSDGLIIPRDANAFPGGPCTNNRALAYSLGAPTPLLCVCDSTQFACVNAIGEFYNY